MDLSPAPHVLRVQIPATTATGPAEDILFGYNIPHLPDWLVSTSLAGQNDRERIGEVLARQTAFITNLAAFQRAAFALRYVYRPSQRAIDIAFLVRGSCPAGEGARLASVLIPRLSDLLSGYGIPAEPFSSATGLTDAVNPIPGGFLVEVRQHEEIVPMRLGDAYVVHPYRATPTTWLATFDTLVRQPGPCALNLYLEPTRLTPAEQNSFAEAAALADTLADYQFQGLTGSQRYADPQAQVVARLYSEALHRLTRPYLLIVQVASTDRASAVGMAHALGAEVSDRVTMAQSAQDGQRLPTGFDVIEPRTSAELDRALAPLRSLRLRVWGQSLASPGKERLRYLVDAETASAAFRFPIGLRGGIPGVRTRQAAPSYDVGPRATLQPRLGIPLGAFLDGRGEAALELKSLTRHTLVAGTNGSGKTTTCLHLLGELWKRDIPFLVIEPAKAEYRTLMRGPLGADVQVFTLGDESTSPFRLNPLELLPGVRVESHLSALQSCLEAAFPTFGPLPTLLEEALHNVYYRDKGWGPTERAQRNETREMPALGDLYAEMVRVTERRGYVGETLQNIRAAVGGRIGGLLRGSKGRMLNTRRSLPFARLMSKPTVLELESLNDEEKALVMLFLLTMIREYCRTTRETGDLQHVTVVEEAHRVMRQTAHAGNREVTADTAAVATGMFSDMLSEVRAFGEGVIIAEQIPGRLAEDALKNTNTKIIHRLPGADDRAAIAATMAATPEQEAYMGKTDQGVCALSAPGYEHPTFVAVHNYRTEHRLPERVRDDAVADHMAEFRATVPDTNRPLQGCDHCLRVCHYRDRIGAVAYDMDRTKRAAVALAEFDKNVKRDDKPAAWRGLGDFCLDSAAEAGLFDDEHAAYCYFVHIARQPISGKVADRVRQAAGGNK